VQCDLSKESRAKKSQRKTTKLQSHCKKLTMVIFNP
jgi:hypothetical protein